MMMMGAAMQYLLWDHDGVLVDTERWYFEATRIVLGRAGLELSEADYLQRMATGRGSWHLLRERGHSADDIAALQHDGAQSRVREVEGGRQAVVARADDDGVIAHKVRIRCVIRVPGQACFQSIIAPATVWQKCFSSIRNASYLRDNSN